MSDSRTPFLDKIKKEFIEKSQQFYPGLEFGNSYSMYSGDEPYSCELEYRFNNNFLKGSSYEFTPDTKLIHYVPSVEILIDIIKSGIFRLTTLNAKNDKHELSYLTKQLKINLSEQVIESHKEQFFCASFSKVNPWQEEDFSMWRLYGSEGKGVALIFELENTNDDWHHFTIGNVQYGSNEASEHYRAFIDFFDDFQKTNNHPIRNRPITSTAFLALHKNIGWKYEDEVRLLSHFEYDKYTLKETSRSNLLTKVFHNYKNECGHYAYIELPLVGSSRYKELEVLFSANDMKDHYEKFKSMLPRLRLVKVILGYQHTGIAYIEIEKILRYQCENHHYHGIQYVPSHFSDHG